MKRGISMKLKRGILLVLLTLVLIGICAGGVLVAQGHKMFVQNVSEESLYQKMHNIRSNPNYTTLDNLPDFYINAVIAAEDNRFYSHNGVDFIAIGRALIHDIQAMSFVEGGSTITQQIAKNEFFTQEKHLTRKISEIFTAFEIEKHYSKDEILEIYVNNIYFGNGYHGIREASLGYYGKEPQELNSYECAMLAGIPNAPSAYAPTANLELAEQRQQQVIKLMEKHGYLDQRESQMVLSQTKS